MRMIRIPVGSAAVVVLAVSSGIVASAFHTPERSATRTVSVSRNVAASFIDTPMDDSDKTGMRLRDDMFFEIDFTDVDRVDAETELLVSRRRELLRNRFVTNSAAGAYRFQIPLTDVDGATQFGMTIEEVTVTAGSVSISNRQLDMDTMRVSLSKPEQSSYGNYRVASDFSGLIVSSVVPNSPTEQAGVVAGDVLMAVSSTIGEAVWPVSTFQGIQAALQSRKVMAGSSVTLELRRLGTHGDETDAAGAIALADMAATSSQYELTLTRPLGFQIGESADGYVVVTGINTMASNLVRHAIAVGDRIVAIDSSLGAKLWPVSTVDGAISAVTGRLPGQAVTFRLERPAYIANDATERNGITLDAAAATQTSTSNVIATTPVTDQRELIKRCREVLKRYSGKEAANRNVAVLRMSAQVADKVVDALACSSATIDSVTLSMIMNAYLQCNQANDAIRIFESATGFSGDGSSNPVKEVVSGKTGGCIVPSESSLNLYTVTALLKAHGEIGDYRSVARVVAALEGRSGELDDVGLESAPWPWTGTFGTIQPDTVCYNVAIAAAEKAGGSVALANALDLFDRMTDKSGKAKAPVRNEVTYNTIISALCNGDMPERAFKIFEQMRRAGLRPDKFTYTSLIRVCVNENDVQELLYDMKESGVKPDVVTYNIMIKSLCSKRQLTEATKLVTEMESRGINPDSRTYGALMNGLLQAGKPSACLTLFEAARANSRTLPLTENVYLYTTAISAASVLGDHQRALELVSRMKANGVKPNLKTLTAVTGACLACGKPELAAQVYRNIERPDGYAVCQGILAFCRSGDLVSALEILEAERRGSNLMSGRQTMVSYENVLCETLVRKEYALARRTFRDLLGKGYIPSKQIIQSLLIALELNERINVESQAVEKFQFLLFLLDSFQARNLPVGSDIYVAAVALGGQVGGLPRMVALLLTRAKATVGFVKEELFPVSESPDTPTTDRVEGWNYLLDNYDSFPRMSLTAERLPLLPVRTTSRDTMRILRAEQTVTSINRKKTLR